LASEDWWIWSKTKGTSFYITRLIYVLSNKLAFRYLHYAHDIYNIKWLYTVLWDIYRQLRRAGGNEIFTNFNLVWIAYSTFLSANFYRTREILRKMNFCFDPPPPWWHFFQCLIQGKCNQMTLEDLFKNLK